MKNFTGILAGILIPAALLVMISGCSARTPVTAEQFQEQAKSLGYTLPEDSDSSDSTGIIQATKSDTQTSAIWYSCSDGSTAQSEYRALVSSIAPESGGGKAVDSDAYNKYTLTNGELYYIVARVDNTVVFCKATLPYQDEADKFIQSIKY